MSDAGIVIGGLVHGVVPDVADAVIKVATCSPDRDVVVEALKTLARLGETTNVTISNNNFFSSAEFEDDEEDE